MPRLDAVAALHLEARHKPCDASAVGHGRRLLQGGEQAAPQRAAVALTPTPTLLAVPCPASPATPAIKPQSTVRTWPCMWGGVGVDPDPGLDMPAVAQAHAQSGACRVVTHEKKGPPSCSR